MLMTYKEWRNWLSNLNWNVKWFVIIILIRPIVDNFYYLKEISPLLSPNYFVGILTPIMALYGIYTIKKPNYSRLDTFIMLFTIISLIGSLSLLISDSFSFNSIEQLIKVNFLSYMYFFLRRMIVTKQDLHGVLQAFVYSSLVVVISFGYELIFQPINVQISRGLERYQGNYSDVLNYALYMCCSLLIICYAYLSRENLKNQSNNLYILLSGTVFAFMILFNIHHTASYVVIGTILILFLVYNFKKNAVIGLGFVAILGGVIYFLGSETVDEKLMPLIETDIEVYEGERDNEMLLHGRVGRWTRFLDYFFEKNIAVQFLGLPLTFEDSYMYTGKGVHNDFVRTLLSVGYSGLFMYLLILINIIIRIIKHNASIQFLGLGVIASLILYSISTTPLLYPPLMYVLLPIVCILTLPKNIMDKK
ncbi:MAG: hypothetical protein KBH11_04905 [Bacteroidia bacterium]|nr:hypothetical protein [Bacteroidota bacterium]MBP9082392.1 hypothetical protein [Bacteroidia bacterium]